MASARMLGAFGAAWIVTFGLFYLMQSLIGVEGELDESKAPKVVDFVRVQRSEVVKQKTREAPKKVTLDETPPPPDMSTDQSTSLDPDAIGVAAVVEESGGGGDGSGGLGIMTADGEAVPLVRVPPQYPERAQQRGIEGRVLVQFTITKSGSVRDPKVIASEPPGVFDQAAMKAVLQWKYNPKIVNGKAVEQPGVKVAFPFKLDQAAG